MVGVPDEAIQQAMVDLPEEYRSVVIMALVEDLSYKEIASALSIPLGTVMSRLHRGRKQLQGTLLEYAQSKGILKQPPDVSQNETA
jgi:RNA polymerase sigma-70 factor (ECF subfamily)